MNRIEELLDYVRLVIEKKEREVETGIFNPEFEGEEGGELFFMSPPRQTEIFPYSKILIIWTIRNYKNELTYSEILDALTSFYLSQEIPPSEAGKNKSKKNLMNLVIAWRLFLQHRLHVHKP